MAKNNNSNINAAAAASLAAKVLGQDPNFKSGVAARANFAAQVVELLGWDMSPQKAAQTSDIDLVIIAILMGRRDLAEAFLQEHLGSPDISVLVKGSIHKDTNTALWALALGSSKLSFMLINNQTIEFIPEAVPMLMGKPWDEQLEALRASSSASVNRKKAARLRKLASQGQ